METSEQAPVRRERPTAMVWRVKVEAEGPSASEVEALFLKTKADIQEDLGVQVMQVGQVIEQVEDGPDSTRPTGHEGEWYRGRLVLAPDIGAQQMPGSEYYRTPEGPRSLSASVDQLAQGARDRYREALDELSDR